MKRISELPVFNAKDMSNIDTDLRVQFFRPVYDDIVNHASLVGKVEVEPLIDFDSFSNNVDRALRTLTSEQERTLRLLGYGQQKSSPRDWNDKRSYKALIVFLNVFPEFSNLFLNCHLPASIAIDAASWHLGSIISGSNFIYAKRLISDFDKVRWIRDQDGSERQSGVSNLGTISESLLSLALESLIDDLNFFKTNNAQIQSYGDFVLMCLPNNLWLSVKSNFARERLLASGYTTDILGVGYFEDFEEFTSLSKIRNFQRVGFLAMYLPDVPINEEQDRLSTNTYEQVVADYAAKGSDLPLNINGTSFLRKLSDLHQDLSALMAVTDVRNRTTIRF